MVERLLAFGATVAISIGASVMHAQSNNTPWQLRYSLALPLGVATICALCGVAVSYSKRDEHEAAAGTHEPGKLEVPH